MSGSWSVDTFDRLYAASDDPWRVQTSQYEQAKYAATLAAIPGARSAAAFEAGCSIGVLTRALAARCDSVLAVDVSEAALRLARARCRDLPSVRFARMALPRGWPGGETFDLMVFAEVLYFMDATDLRLTAAQAAASLGASGSVVLVNWIGETDTPMTGDAAADLFITASGLALESQTRAPGYRLDVLRNGRHRGR
jgi:SAM-dependent methyltransferase